MSELVIESAGGRWSGWREVEITRSMDFGAHEFYLKMTSAKAAEQALADGEPVSILFGNELITTGYVDEILPEYDSDSIDVVIKGRSKTADLIDCSTVGQQFKRQGYLNVAKRLAQPFGITVSAAPGVNANVAMRQPAIDDGQPIWDFLEQEARALAFRPIVLPDGNLLITQTGTDYADERLVLGENILRASGTFSRRQRYSEYRVIATQTRDNPLLTGRQMNHNHGISFDKNVKRFRPLVIVADDDLNNFQCTQRARWQRNTHYGRGQQVVYTVKGWAQSSGKTWPINTLVEVDDPVGRINGPRLIVETRMLLNEDGRLTEISVMPPEAMSLQALPPRSEERLF